MNDGILEWWNVEAAVPLRVRTQDGSEFAFNFLGGHGILILTLIYLPVDILAMPKF